MLCRVLIVSIAGVLSAWLPFVGFPLQAADLASSRPVVSNFSPLSGAPGTSVTINGSNFSNVREVRFNNAIAIFTSVSATRVVATVPLDATTGPVSVITALGTGTSLSYFQVAPRIANFFPTNGSPGTLVTLEGANFGGATAVQFNNKNAASFSVTAENQIHATVPAGASSGPINVITPVGVALSTNDFVITGTEPIISDFAPTNGAPGTIVVLEGRNFTGATAVKFNGTNAAAFSVTSPTQINATVPAGATTGPISVTSRSGTGTSTRAFLVTNSPVITDFSPTNGPPGTMVVINGFNFTGASAVRFHGTNAANFSVTSPTQINATVPPNATTGPIGVVNQSGSGTSDAVFVVATNPIINDFSPTNGAPGTIVVIDGINFNGATAVKFSDTNAAFSVTSPTQINATVPTGATTGPISITTPKGTGVSANRFTVNAGVPGIASFTPTVGLPGTSVTLEGLNFTGATAVKFNGTNAPFSVTAPTQILCTVPAGATTGPISVTTPAGTGFSAAKFIVAPGIASFSPSAGVAGSSVAIRGTNFTDVIAVRFNGVSANFTNASPNEITATVPTNGTSGRISVTTPAGIVASAEDFTILPNLLSFSPLAGAVGTRVTLSGTHIGDAIAVQFNGVNGPFNAISAGEIQATVPLGATTGPITVITPSGSSRSLGIFTVAASADLVAGASASPTVLPAGDNLSITVSVTNQGPALATSVTLTNTLPLRVFFVSATASQGNFRLTNGVVVCNFGNLPSGAGATLKIVLTPTAVGNVTNSVAVTATEFDPTTANNSAVVVAQVVAGPTTLRIQFLPDNRLTLSWPTVATNYVLQTADVLAPPISWSYVTNGPVVLGNEKTLTLPLSGRSKFYRLNRP